MKQLILIFLCIVCTPAWAHIGSPGVQMQAQAGPYRLLVNVQPPAVIPGTAKLTVFVEGVENVRIEARPIYFRSGGQGAPSADPLLPVSTGAAQYQGDVWFMENGSSSVQIAVTGRAGKGECVVPVMAMSTAQNDMPKGLGVGLSVMGVFLLLLLITAVGSSVSDALLQPGKALSSPQKRQRRLQMAVAFVVCVVLLYGGSSWWDSWADEYRQFVYQPMKATATIKTANDEGQFELKIDTTDWKQRRRGAMLGTLIPDHGKLMHAFLIRTPGLDAFAHIHPERRDSVTFTSPLPALPAGKYVVYADIVNYSGFAETITDTIDIPIFKPNPSKQLPPDDAYVLTDAIFAPGKVNMGSDVVICGKPGTKTVFQDKSYAIWEGKPDQPFEAGKTYELRFETFNPDNSPFLPEPYMGMTGHAVVMRDDGSVYIHLHPTGSFSMAAGTLFKHRLGDTTKLIQRPPIAAFRDSVDKQVDRLNAMEMPDREIYLMTEMGMFETSPTGGMGMDHSNQLTFPYAFPKPGRYRIFLQVRRNNKVVTGVFDATVKASPTEQI